MITIEHVELTVIVRFVDTLMTAPDFYRVSCPCGWTEDVGWLSDAEELASEHERLAECDW